MRIQFLHLFAPHCPGWVVVQTAVQEVSGMGRSNRLHKPSWQDLFCFCCPSSLSKMGHHLHQFSFSMEQTTDLGLGFSARISINSKWHYHWIIIHLTKRKSLTYHFLNLEVLDANTFFDTLLVKWLVIRQW